MGKVHLRQKALWISKPPCRSPGARRVLRASAKTSAALLCRPQRARVAADVAGDASPRHTPQQTSRHSFAIHGCGHGCGRKSAGNPAANPVTFFPAGTRLAADSRWRPRTQGRLVGCRECLENVFPNLSSCGSSVVKPPFKHQNSQRCGSESAPQLQIGRLECCCLRARIPPEPQFCLWGGVSLCGVEQVYTEP